MAPPRIIRAATTRAAAIFPLPKKGISTRSKNIQDQNIEPITTRAKRKADNSPLKNDKVKRSALGNLTNNVINLHLDDDKKLVLSKKPEPVKNSIKVVKPMNESIILQPTNILQVRATKIVTRAAAKNLSVPSVPVTTAVKSKETLEVVKPPTRRISNEFEKTDDDSLYMSALEDIPSSDSLRLSMNFEKKRRSQSQPDMKFSFELTVNVEDNVFEGHRILTPSPLKQENSPVPDGVSDFDKENWNDQFQVSHYAMDIFNYLKQRECKFIIEDYMERQVYLTKFMRSLLVDWMVEVQETFELNHETLYLAVKIVDIYLGKIIVAKDNLQLLGAAALFIACKYDERTPPMVDDFLYICDGAYNQSQLVKMEMNVFKTIEFDLGIPLSYRFLRRYARCAKILMPTLTLARYVLEFSLMDYTTISFSDSKMACAALFIGLRMADPAATWNPTLEYFTGYQLEDFAYIASVLNIGLHKKPRESIKTIRNKYSHKIFYEVAKKPLLTHEQLFGGTSWMDQTE